MVENYVMDGQNIISHNVLFIYTLRVRETNKNILIFSRKNVPERDFRVQSDTLASDCFTRTIIIIIRFHKVPTQLRDSYVSYIILYELLYNYSAQNLLLNYNSTYCCLLV